MTGKQLKNSILQLAILGKLVPQDPNDEPASELLKRIRKEKEQLVKDGKLKKKDLTINPISDEEKPFEIPESWEWCRLNNIAKFNGGYAFKSINYTNNGEGMRVLRISDFDETGINSKSPVFHPYSIELDKFRLEKGDIIMCMTGGTVGKSCQIKVLFEPMLVNQRVADIKINQHVFSDYIYTVISSAYIKEIVNEAKNSTNDNISAELINNFIIPLPPLAEQRRIVAKIGELMPLVDEYDKAQKKLDKLNTELPERLKKSILQEAIMGKLVPQDPNDEPASELLKRIRKEKEQLVKDGKLKKKDLTVNPISDEEKPFEIPESWEWCRIAEISSSYIGLTYKPADVSDVGTVVLRSSNIQNGEIDLKDIVRVNIPIGEKLIVHSGDILICARNGSKKLVGKSAIITEDAEGMTFGAFMAICKTPFSKYVYNYLSSDLFFSQLRSVSGTTTINQLTQNNFNKFLIPLPPLAEQRRIVAKIEELFAQLKSLN